MPKYKLFHKDEGIKELKKKKTKKTTQLKISVTKQCKSCLPNSEIILILVSSKMGNEIPDSALLGIDKASDFKNLNACLYIEIYKLLEQLVELF